MTSHALRPMRTWAITGAAFLLVALMPPLAAQDWPAKPIRVIVNVPPGGGIDQITRVAAPRLSEALGQPVLIDNRGGAGGNIGVEQVARSVPDGYTLFVSSQTTLTCGVPSARIVAMWAKLGAARTDRTASVSRATCSVSVWVPYCEGSREPS